MFRRPFRRGRKAFALRPVDSTKNVIQFSGTVSHGQRTLIDLVRTYKTEEYPGGAPGVLDGSKVPSIELHVRGVNTGSGSLNPIVMVLYKQESGQADLTFADLIALDGCLQKRNLLHIDQLNALGGGPQMEWHIRLKIPRSKHMFQKPVGGVVSDDKLRLAIANNDAAADTFNFCGFAIYKWYK